MVDGSMINSQDTLEVAPAVHRFHRATTKCLTFGGPVGTRSVTVSESDSACSSAGLQHEAEVDGDRYLREHSFDFYGLGRA